MGSGGGRNPRTEAGDFATAPPGSPIPVVRGESLNFSHRFLCGPSSLRVPSASSGPRSTRTFPPWPSPPPPGPLPGAHYLFSGRPAGKARGKKAADQACAGKSGASSFPLAASQEELPFSLTYPDGREGGGTPPAGAAGLGGHCLAQASRERWMEPREGTSSGRGGRRGRMNHL